MQKTANNSPVLPLIWRISGIAAFLALWQVASLIVRSALILPGPVSVAEALFKMSGHKSFWLAIGGSFLRVLEAFFLSIAIGLATGSMSGASPRIKAALSPLITSVRATPVLALILIAMFWFPSSQVPVFSAVLMAFPVMHTSAEFGVRATDEKLAQMSRLFHVPKRNIFWQLKLPSAFPHILAGAKNALGLSWKVIVAGEVLSQPRFALGTGMQEARLSLETNDVFAWAAMTIALCGLSEYLFGLLVRSIGSRFHTPSGENSARGES